MLNCKPDGYTVQVLQMLIKKCNWLQGEALFQTQENLEHLAMMERFLGPFVRYHSMTSIDYISIFMFIENSSSSMSTIVSVSATMQRSMSEGVDWTGQKVQPLGKVLKLL